MPALQSSKASGGGVNLTLRPQPSASPTISNPKQSGIIPSSQFSLKQPVNPSPAPTMHYYGYVGPNGKWRNGDDVTPGNPIMYNTYPKSSPSPRPTATPGMVVPNNLPTNANEEGFGPLHGPNIGRFQQRMNHGKMHNEYVGGGPGGKIAAGQGFNSFVPPRGWTQKPGTPNTGIGRFTQDDYKPRIVKPKIAKPYHEIPGAQPGSVGGYGVSTSGGMGSNGFPMTDSQRYSLY